MIWDGMWRRYNGIIIGYNHRMQKAQTQSIGIGVVKEPPGGC